VPVLTAYVINTATGALVFQESYNQDQLPVILTHPTTEEVVFAFACGFSTSAAQYTYTGIVYGVGFAACNNNYTVYSGSREAIYARSAYPAPQINIMSAPLYASTLVGTLSTSQITFGNPSKLPESINLSVQGALAGVVSFSSKSIKLAPGANISIELTFNPSTALVSGTYIIPVNITIGSSGGTVKRQFQFITLTVYNATTKPNIMSQINFINSTKTIDGSLLIVNPSNSTLNNVSVYTYIPQAIAQNISSISTSGIASNVSTQDGLYSILWNVGALLPMSSVTAYYTVQDVRNVQQVILEQNLLYASSLQQPSSSSVLKVVNVEFPALYTNASAAVNVSVLYNGASSHPVNFVLTAPKDITVINGSQSVNATPGQFLTAHFGIESDSTTGTFVFVLYLSTPGANLTYYIPAIVSQRLQVQNQLTSIPASTMRDIVYWAVAAITVVVVIAAILSARGKKKKGRARYNAERVQHLIRIRKSMERE
jgi:hypothetical protein